MARPIGSDFETILDKIVTREVGADEDTCGYKHKMVCYTSMADNPLTTIRNLRLLPQHEERGKYQARFQFHKSLVSELKAKVNLIS
jgi:hypothetical protein